MATRTQEMIHKALRHIDRCLHRGGKSLINFPHMPVPPAQAVADEDDHDDDHIAVDEDAHQNTVNNLNPMQRENYNTITTAVDNADGTAFFLYCAGGTGAYPLHERRTVRNLQARPT